MKKAYFILFVISLSCGKINEDLQLEQSFSRARSYLTKYDCSEAQTALDEIDSSHYNKSSFIKLQASVYACKANVSESKLFTDDIINLNTTSFLTSFASFSSSNETEAEGNSFNYVMQALDLLYASGQIGDHPSSADRYLTYGTKEGEALSYQALYLTLIELGKYAAYYGNTDDEGFKGRGAGINECIYTYTDPTSIAIISAGTSGLCDTPGESGHPQLDSGTAGVSDEDVVRRLCHGVYLFNHAWDIFSTVALSTLSNTANLSSLEDVKDTIQTLRDDVLTYIPASEYIDLYTMDECMNEVINNDTSRVGIEQFISILFELSLLSS